MGATPIPTSEIVAWLDLHLIHDLEDRLEYSIHISTLDSAWLSWARARKE